jgi:hypothetical protein
VDSPIPATAPLPCIDLRLVEADVHVPRSLPLSLENI